MDFWKHLILLGVSLLHLFDHARIVDLGRINANLAETSERCCEVRAGLFCAFVAGEALLSYDSTTLYKMVELVVLLLQAVHQIVSSDFVVVLLILLVAFSR